MIKIVKTYTSAIKGFGHD